MLTNTRKATLESIIKPREYQLNPVGKYLFNVSSKDKKKNVNGRSNGLIIVSERIRGHWVVYIKLTMTK